MTVPTGGPSDRGCCSPVVAFQKRTVPSRLAEMTSFPSGEKPTDVTTSRWRSFCVPTLCTAPGGKFAAGAGASDGTGDGEALGAGDALALRDGLGRGDGLALGDGLAVGDGLAFGAGFASDR
jgi:hypothetical protein